MGADTAGAAARLGLTSAVRSLVLGPLPIRRILLVLLASFLVAATALSLLASWNAGRAADTPVPARTADRLDLIASVFAYELQLAAGGETPSEAHMGVIKRRLPPLALADRRTAYISDRHGQIVATTTERAPRLLTDLFDEDDVALTGTLANVGRTRLRDGTPVLVAVRALSSGSIAVVQPYATARLDDHHAYLIEAAPVACILALAGLGIGCARHRRNARIDRQRRSRTSRIDASMSHGRCGVWDWDTTRNRIFWSPSMYQLLGYEPRGEHLTAGEVVALLHPDDGSIRDLVTGLSADSAGALDREIRLRTAAGEWLWLRIKGEAVHEPADGSRHVVGLAVDVTAEREAAERRARDDLRLREAVEALTEAFVLWDADDRLIVCNSKFMALHGIEAMCALPGTPSREIMAAAEPPRVMRELDVPAAEAEDTRLAETQTADGRWFHVSEHRTRDGGVVSVGTDVSELKRKEERLEAREQHLRGSIRAAETAAQCYALAAERNYEANQAKTEFLARVSHELRTPLNAIIGFSEVMRQQLLGPLDDRYASYTTGIHASGVKLLEIIDGILQMSRIDKGQMTLAPELLSLGDVVGDVIATVRADTDAKSVGIEADIAGPLMLQADPDALREVLLQLVRNAVKFSLCEGRVRVRVRPALGRINVFVEDAGIGIPAEVLPELGRPFAQVEAEYNRSYGGAGLGLAIAQSLLDMHGGRLSLRSQPGVGTIALVSLPKVQPAANDASCAEAGFPPRIRLVAAE